MKIKKREHARLLRLKTIQEGEMIEGQAGKFYMLDKKAISRAKVFGVVTQRYDSEENNFISLTLDDGSDTIRLKLWKQEFSNSDGTKIDNLLIVEGVIRGDMIDVIGKIREYQNEFYIVPETIQKYPPEGTA